jgi:hypothetical protein
VLELDGKGWREISKILAATLDKVVETSRNSRARLADSAEGPIRATGGLMLFEPMPGSRLVWPWLPSIAP